MNWSKIMVMDYGKFLGSFYTESWKKSDIIKEIDERYGKGKWTSYNIGN